jgi:hypothetical protein
MPVERPRATATSRQTLGDPGFERIPRLEQLPVNASYPSGHTAAAIAVQRICRDRRAACCW